MENCSERFLFGGAISSNLPVRFEDVSNIRQVPDHQEAFVDLARDESVLFELLDLKNDVADDGSAVWFLRDLATEQDAEGNLVIEHSGSTERISLHGGYPPAIVNTAIGQMAVSKEREGNSARNIIRVYVANLRLKDVNTDVLITANEPVDINPLSASAKTVRAGPAVPASLSGCLPVAEVFKIAVTSFKENPLKKVQVLQNLTSPLIRVLTIINCIQDASYCLLFLGVLDRVSTRTRESYSKSFLEGRFLEKRDLSWWDRSRDRFAEMGSIPSEKISDSDPYQRCIVYGQNKRTVPDVGTDRAVQFLRTMIYGGGRRRQAPITSKFQIPK